VNIIEKIRAAMDDDDDNLDKQSEILLADYAAADDTGKALIDAALVCVCGWSLKTLIEGRPDPVTAQGSNGSFTFDPKTGEVIQHEPDPSSDEPYTNIVRVDVAEWRLAYPGEALEDVIDILDLGYWMKDGTYEPPAEDWREDFRAARSAQ
jgi:hypothetical protein